MQHALVRKIEAFEPLTDSEREALIGLCSSTRSVKRRHDVVSEGSKPTHVNVVLQGWAARYSVNRAGARRITAFLLPGDFCDVHVTSLNVMDHGITAITDCEIGIVYKEDIDVITRATPALTLAFWRSTLVDEAVLRQWLANAGRRTAIECIAHLLCELHVRLALVGLVYDGQFAVPLTQEELADAAGLTNVHVNRMLKALTERGLIDRAGDMIVIPDVAALRHAADFDPTYLHLKS